MERFDVLVAGAGASGMCAAVAAAREGARVLLVEKTGLLGGSNTQSLVCPLMGFHAGGQQVVRGLAQEIVERLREKEGTLGHIPDPLGVAETITPIEPETLREVYFDLLREEKGISPLLHTLVMEAHVEDGRIQGITMAGKAGKTEARASVYIDATGDGDLAAASGVPFTQGRPSDGAAQPMTLLMKLGGVDLEKVRSFMRRSPSQFVLRDDWDTMPYIAVSGFFEKVEQARARGELTLPRDRVLFFQGVREGEVIVNMGRVIQCRSTDAMDMTRAEMEGRRQVREILNFLKNHVDGFEASFLVETGATIGVRESRHFRGLYTLQAEDVLRGAMFDDAVAMCGFPMDIHDPLGKDLAWTQMTQWQGYDIPYRVMVPETLENLLVTGRCVSATHEAAASARITPTAMALGEAAGIAAALSKETRVQDMDTGLLRERIRTWGGIPGRESLPR